MDNLTLMFKASLNRDVVVFFLLFLPVFISLALKLSGTHFV